MSEVTLESQLIEIIKDADMADHIKHAKIDMLIRLGVDVNVMYGARSPLRFAKDNNLEKVAELLENNGGKNIFDEETAKEFGKKLIEVCANGEKKDVEEIKELIDMGADVKAEDDYGYTALMWASQSGHKEVVEFLIQNGADVNQKDNNGCTALMEASKSGHKEVVELLIQQGVDINQKDNYGATALIRASKRGYEEIVELLIQNGADVNAENNKGETALMLAFDNKTEKIIKRAVSKKVLLDKIKKGFGIGK